MGKPLFIVSIFWEQAGYSDGLLRPRH